LTQYIVGLKTTGHSTKLCPNMDVKCIRSIQGFTVFLRIRNYVAQLAGLIV